MSKLPLDPKPYVHRCWDDGTCAMYGDRLATTHRGINDEFEPREGYEQDWTKYPVRQTRILRDRMRARSLKARVDGISRSLTDNWHDTSNISFLLQGGFREIHTLIEKHTREIEVLWHRVVDEEATASDAPKVIERHDLVMPIYEESCCDVPGGPDRCGDCPKDSTYQR